MTFDNLFSYDENMLQLLNLQSLARLNLYTNMQYCTQEIQKKSRL